MRSAWFLLLIWLGPLACGGNPLPAESDKPGAASETQKPEEQGRAVTPPFALQGELDGLLLVWFDDKGLHTATKRSEIPEAQRARVRVDSLTVPPDKRLDAEHVYVADLRAPAANGSYAVRVYPRVWFEAQADALGAPVQAAAMASNDVTIYMASWCGACRAAEKFMRSRDIPFVAKDIEKDAAANSEMQQKAQAAGKTPRGVPVIDFRGHIILGFDQNQIERLIAAGKPI